MVLHMFQQPMAELLGAVGTEAMYEVTVDTFASQLACSSAYTAANSIADVESLEMDLLGGF